MQCQGGIQSISTYFMFQHRAAESIKGSNLLITHKKTLLFLDVSFHSPTDLQVNDMEAEATSLSSWEFV